MAAKERDGWIGPLAGAFATACAASVALAPRRGLIAGQAVDVAEHFSPAELRSARRFGRPQLMIGLTASAVDAAVLIWLVRRRRRSDDETQPTRRPLVRAALSGGGLSLGLTAAGLPLSALARRRALRAGLATQSWGGWAVDVGKAATLNTGFAAAGSALAVGLMRRRGERWWQAGAAGAVGIAGAVTLLGPVVLDPLFNEFSPLEDARTRGDVMELARASGVRIGGVYVMDASRRTRAANAYVNGIGPTRRVVLFDTLLDAFSRDETRLVVAHELAHVRHRDVARQIGHLALSAPASLRAAAVLTRRLDRGRAPAAGTLPALALAFGCVSAVTSLPVLALSRRVERRADSDALRLTGAPQAFVGFERRITLQNLADPDPPRLLNLLLGSHPTTIERIGIARAFAAQQA